jgi:hypothetical protein
MGGRPGRVSKVILFSEFEGDILCSPFFRLGKNESSIYNNYG